MIDQLHAQEVQTTYVHSRTHGDLLSRVLVGNYTSLLKNMYSLRSGFVALVIASLAIAPLAFADNDNGGTRNSKRKNDNNSSFVFNPFTSVGTTTDALQTQVKSLQDLLNGLKAQRRTLDNASTTNAARDALKVQIKATKSDLKQAKKELRFARSLVRGMSGDDVRDLQELLAQDSSLFSLADVSGFFGPRTEVALREFQRKHGIGAIGIFGPQTQAKIFALFAGRELPAGIIARLGLETSSTTPGQGLVAICHKPIGTTPQSLVIAIPSLGAHLSHGDSVGVCPGSGTPQATTTPPTPPTDTTAPTLSSILFSGISSTTATASWNTDENAVSKVYYATTSPVNLLTALNVGTASSTTLHVHTLFGLTASTTYFAVLESKDAANNTATGSQQSFITR